jgi:hypothetical protein
MSLTDRIVSPKCGNFGVSVIEEQGIKDRKRNILRPDRGIEKDASSFLRKQERSRSVVVLDAIR